VEEGIPVEAALLPLEVRLGTTSGSETVTSGLLCVATGCGKGSAKDVDWLVLDVPGVGWLDIGEGIDIYSGESDGVVLMACGWGLVSN
jgi:hypothetical protein